MTRNGNFSQFGANIIIASAENTTISYPAVSQRDTLSGSLPDSLPVSRRDTLSGSLPDSLPVSLRDTLSGPLPDSLPVSRHDTLSGPLPDSLPEFTFPMIGEGDLERDTVRSVTEQTEMPARGTKSVSGVEKTYKYDATYYLDNEINKPFLREHLFPISRDTSRESFLSGQVFVEQDNSVFKNASETYKSYLLEDMTENSYKETYFSSAWIPALIILSLLLLTWIKIVYVRFFTPVLLSAFNYKKAAKLSYEKSAHAQNAFTILNIIFIINTGLFLFFIFGYFDIKLPDLNDKILFLFISAIIVLLFGLKSVSLGVVGFLFDKSKLFSEYKHNVSLYNKIYGILILPINIGFFYASEFAKDLLIFIGIGLAAGFYLLQMIRGVEIIIKKEFSVFYLILYLCTLEIFPILVLYKLFQVLLI